MQSHNMSDYPSTNNSEEEYDPEEPQINKEETMTTAQKVFENWDISPYLPSHTQPQPQPQSPPPATVTYGQPSYFPPQYSRTAQGLQYTQNPPTARQYPQFQEREPPYFQQ